VTPGDGWLSLDDENEAVWEAMLFSRWPVPDDVVRGPPDDKVTGLPVWRSCLDRCSVR